MAGLQRELDELTYGGKTEEEVALLRKQKIDLERRLHDQEEELDELAGQVQLLEQAKLKLEMNLEQMRKVAKKEAMAHEEELEDVRCSAQKKLKSKLLLLSYPLKLGVNFCVRFLRSVGSAIGERARRKDDPPEGEARAGA